MHAQFAGPLRDQERNNAEFGHQHTNGGKQCDHEAFKALALNVLQALPDRLKIESRCARGGVRILVFSATANNIPDRPSQQPVA